MFGQPNNKSLFGSSNTTSAFGQPNTSTFGVQSTQNTGPFGTMSGQLSTNINTRHQCITCMREYETKSLEELRLEDYTANRKGPQQSIGMFGSTGAVSSSSLFGTTNTTQNAFSSNTNTGLFGQNKPLFGTNTTFPSGQTSAPTTSMFGSVSASNPTLNNTFFSGTANNTAAVKPLFGGTTTQPQQPLFGQTTQQNQNLGQKPLFGNNSPSVPQFGTNASTLFNPNTSSNLFSSSQPSLFNTGTTSTNTLGAKPLFNFNNPTSLPLNSSIGGTSGVTSTQSLFGNSSTFGNSMFGTNQPNFNFGSANTSFPSSNTFQTNSSLQPMSVSTQAQNNDQLVTRFQTFPYGDSPQLQIDVTLPSNARLRTKFTTDPKTLNQYKMSAKTIESRPQRIVNNSAKNTMLFEGLEDHNTNDNKSAKDIFVPRKNIKKLVFKPKNTSTMTDLNVNDSDLDFIIKGLPENKEPSVEQLAIQLETESEKSKQISGMDCYLEYRMFCDYEFESLNILKTLNGVYFKFDLSFNNNVLILRDSSGKVIKITSGLKGDEKLLRSHLSFLALNHILAKNLFENKVIPNGMVNLNDNCCAILSTVQMLLNLDKFNFILEVEKNRDLKKNKEVKKGPNSLFYKYNYFRSQYKRFANQWMKALNLVGPEKETKITRLDNEMNKNPLKLIIESMGLTDRLFPKKPEEMKGYHFTLFLDIFFHQLCSDLDKMEMFPVVDNMISHSYDYMEFIITVDFKDVTEDDCSLQKRFCDTVDTENWIFNHYLLVYLTNRMGKTIKIQKNLSINGNKYTLNSAILVVKVEKTGWLHAYSKVLNSGQMYRLDEVFVRPTQQNEDINKFGSLIAYEKNL